MPPLQYTRKDEFWSFEGMPDVARFRQTAPDPDLDETLIYAKEQPQATLGPYDVMVGPYRVWKRPFVDTFLATVATWFDLAVWTVSSDDYAQAIVSYLFPDPTLLRFVWARPRCTWHQDTEWGTTYWIKDLNKLKRLRTHPLERVLVIDDSAEKLKRHYGNLIPIAPFEGDREDTELRDLLPYLSKLRSVPNVRCIEKRTWREPGTKN